MRIDAILSLGLLLAAHAGPAAAGPVRLEIETAQTPRDPFVVTVTGHYADIHNGYSRTWKRALVPAGAAQWLPLGPEKGLLTNALFVFTMLGALLFALSTGKPLPRDDSDPLAHVENASTPEGASLPDSIPDAPRRRAFALYAALLPFRVPARQALRELVAHSLAREQRWTGAGCALAREIGAPAGDAFRSRR